MGSVLALATVDDDGSCQGADPFSALPCPALVQGASSQPLLCTCLGRTWEGLP